MSHPPQTQRVGALTNHLLGDHLVGELLASGEMAEVYRGRNQIHGREVAIKFMRLGEAANPDLMRRFHAEARHMKTLRHPQIVPLEAFGEVDGGLYLVMPLYPESLRDHLESSGQLLPVAATKVALQIAAALRITHARGIVHRDVKPENIFLNKYGNAFLADFGIAREISALQQPDVTWTRSSSGLPVGTPEYMAPEQLRGEPADQRVDTYALGVVLYESLTGRTLFEAATPYAVAALVLSHQITPPSAYAPGMWPTLERVLLQALAYDARDRYPDMESFEEALRNALNVMERERDGELWDRNLAMPEDLTAHPEPIAADLDVSQTISNAHTSLAHAPRRVMARARRAKHPSWLEMLPNLTALRALARTVGIHLRRQVGETCGEMWVRSRLLLNQAGAFRASGRRSVQAAWRLLFVSIVRWHRP
jgi:serine/threonine protein kinase